MWRAMFLAIGIFILAFGVECLGVEKMVLTVRNPPPKRLGFFATDPNLAPPKEFAPKPFLPWSMISVGAVICLYSVTLRRNGGG